MPKKSTTLITLDSYIVIFYYAGTRSMLGAFDSNEIMQKSIDDKYFHVSMAQEYKGSIKTFMTHSVCRQLWRRYLADNESSISIKAKDLPNDQEVPAFISWLGKRILNKTFDSVWVSPPRPTKQNKERYFARINQLKKKQEEVLAKEIAERVKMNKPGRFYVSELCKSCGACHAKYPSIFKSSGGTKLINGLTLAGVDRGSYVYKQPETPMQILNILDAMEKCKSGAIIDRSPQNGRPLKNQMKEYRDQILATAPTINFEFLLKSFSSAILSSLDKLENEEEFLLSQGSINLSDIPRGQSKRINSIRETLNSIATDSERPNVECDDIAILVPAFRRLLHSNFCTQLDRKAKATLLTKLERLASDLAFGKPSRAAINIIQIADSFLQESTP